MRLSDYFVVINHSIYDPRHHQAMEQVMKLGKNHQVDVFFYEDAVFAGSVLLQPPAGHPSPADQWSSIKTENISLTLCIAAAVRRGIFDATEAKRYGKPITINENFKLGGLGLVAEALHNKRQVLQF